MHQPNHAIDITVATSYLVEQSEPNENRYLFSYTVTLHNSGRRSAQLRTRHWIITDGNGKVQEVRGEGVVGEQPSLAPGASYSYTSGTLLETPVGTMTGSYQMVDEEGEEFDAEIPRFTLNPPNALH